MSSFSWGAGRSTRRRGDRRRREKTMLARFGRGWRTRWLDWFHPSIERLEERALLANQPDLLITAATAPNSAIEGNASQISISWTVKNQGNAPATGDWTDSVYLSS